MAVLIALSFLYLPLTLAYVFAVAKFGERRYLVLCTVAAWLVLGLLVYAIDGWLPFAGGGDDESYFDLAKIPLYSFREVFDFSRFAGLIDQPGYPWVLTMLNVLAGQSLLAYKLSNLCFLILTALTWYRIAVLLESREFARFVMAGVLLLTPFWYYSFFLLKDMPIVFLQGLFLLGLIQYWLKPSFRSVLLVIVPTLAILVFRSPLALQHVVVIGGMMALKVFSAGRLSTRVYTVTLGVFAMVGVLAVATNPELMAKLGVYQQSRVAGTDAAFRMAYSLSEESGMRRELFPVTYLFIEINGLSPQAWEVMNVAWFRGLLALPWIFFVVPFLAPGLIWLLKSPAPEPRSGVIFSLRRSRMLSTPWAVLLIFIVTSISVSWIVGDTTRWRISDLPAILTVSVAGWLYTGRLSRWHLLAYWLTGLGMLMSAYYLMVEL